MAQMSITNFFGKTGLPLAVVLAIGVAVLLLWAASLDRAYADDGSDHGQPSGEEAVGHEEPQGEGDHEEPGFDPGSHL